MTTAVWVILCVLGLVTGFALGWSRRHRPPADPAQASPTDAAEPLTAEAQVIDLRVVPEQAAPPRPDHPPAVSAPARAAEGHPGPASPGLSLAPTEGATPVDSGAGPERPDAQVIDLAAAKPVPLHNLQFIDEIGPRVDKRLRANGIVTVPDLAALRRKELRRILDQVPGAPDEFVTRLRDDARSMVGAAERGRIAPEDPGRELRRVQGIGTTMMRWLETQGITTLAQLARLTTSDVSRLEAELSDYPGRIRAEKWRGQARSLIG